MKNEKRAAKLRLTKSTLKNLMVRSHLKAGESGCTNNSGQGGCGFGDSTGGPGERRF